MTDGPLTGGNAVGDDIGAMGWIELPYGCYGLARRARNDTIQAWSWLVVVPWAANDSKPWIDGTHLVNDPKLDDAQQRERVLIHMRELLDKRYGETMGARATDEFIKKLQSE